MPRGAGLIDLPRRNGMKSDPRPILTAEGVAVVHKGDFADEPAVGRRCRRLFRLNGQDLLHLRNHAFQLVVQWPVDYRQNRRGRHAGYGDGEAPRMAATAISFAGRRRKARTTTARAAHPCNLSPSHLKRVEPPLSPLFRPHLIQDLGGQGRLVLRQEAAVVSRDRGRRVLDGVTGLLV